MRSHEWLDRRSLALHEAVASKLETDPGLVAKARSNLDRSLRTNPSPALEEWRDILESATVPDLLLLLRSPTESAVRLRQSSPFAGVLSAEERRRVMTSHEPPRS